MDLFQKVDFDSCPNCTGTGIEKEDSYIQLLDVCWKCGGEGKVDWVTAVVQNPHNHPPINPDVTKRVVLQNIALLKNRIVEQGHKMGLYIDVKFDAHSINETNLQMNPLIFQKERKLNVLY